MADQRNSCERRGSRLQSQGPGDIEGDRGTVECRQEIGTMKSFPRAKWSHQMKLFLVELLKDHDVPGFRTQKAWSKEAWTNIVCRLNQKFCVSFTINQVKQKEQDLKKDYRSVKDLLAESGFGWDSERMMVDAPENVWVSFAARKNNKDVMQWRGKSFPYYNELAPLYDGRYAEGRTHHGMDHYATKPKHASIPSSHPVDVTNMYQSPSPTILAPGQSGLPISLEEDVEEGNLDFGQHSTTPMEHMNAQPRSSKIHSEKPNIRCGKKQKRNPTEPGDGFHERYLKLKKEEIDRFVAIEEKKLEDPFSIHKCITSIEGLNGLQLGDMLMAVDIFKTKENREVFLSFSSDALRLAWITREITRSKTNYQN